VAADTLVTALFEAYNRGDSEAAGALYAADGTHTEVALGSTRSGSEDIASGLMSFLKAFPDARWREERRVAAGADVVVLYELTASLQSDFGPFVAKGQPLRLRGAQAVAVGEDGIRSTTDYWDAATFARHMNAEPAGAKRSR
jgi:steroid delta-isomerase-like uncharacterized protein